MKLDGIGPVTASALVASVGNGHDFKNGRQLAAWLGLVPGMHGSGGKTRLGRITKAGGVKRVNSGKRTQAQPLPSRRADYGSDRVRLPDLTLSLACPVARREPQIPPQT